jgi:hypothetical protein
MPQSSNYNAANAFTYLLAVTYQDWKTITLGPKHVIIVHYSYIFDRWLASL